MAKEEENRMEVVNLTREQKLSGMLDRNLQKSEDEKREFGEVVRRAEQHGVVFKKKQKGNIESNG